MKIEEILEQYSDASLDKISTDKVDEAVSLRLPRTVIIQEVVEALKSLTYVAEVLAPTRPPTYSFIKLLLDAPGYALPVEGFQEKVFEETKEMTTKSVSGKGLSTDKNYQLYLKILKTAWEDGVIERSEALLLESLREELGIWTREHLLLEHHPDIDTISDFSTAFISTRNYLLVKGLVLTFDNSYILAEEVALQIRRVWGMALENDPYRRLLDAMTKQQLYNILEKTRLQVSGSKEEQVRRIIDALIPPTEALNFLHIDELRELCRHTNAPVSGIKADVIGNIIEHFDRDRDLMKDEEIKSDEMLPGQPEERTLNNFALKRLLQNLTIDQLYDVLSSSFLRTSGTKEMKIMRLVESPWSEISMINRLRRTELSNLCRKLGIQVSGVKTELIDRLVEWGAALSDSSSLQDNVKNVPLTNQTEIGTGISSPAIPDVSEFEDEVTTAPTIPGLDDIKREYPCLEPDEQVILALVKDIKSLTEQDIERASHRHGFDWFLTKAHMAELVAKLKSVGNLPLRIRSVRSVNIYEWCGDTRQRKVEIEKAAARDVINAFRQGVVPEKHIDLLIVGQDNARGHLVDLLEEIRTNKSAFKFIRGPYGAGKTFLCSWLRQYALDNEYVVSLINIGPDQPLSDLPVFFSGIINGLRTPEKRDSCALTDVLESWLLGVHRKTAQIENLRAFDRSERERLLPLVEERIETELAAISNIDPCFPPALRSFYRARISGDPVIAGNAAAWLSGSRSMPAKSLNEIGVRGYLEANQVFPRMRALLEIIAGSRFKGLLLMVDELELIRRFPHTRQREQALETLRLLIDETGKNGLPGCLLIFTGTDTFFEDDRAGLKSYEALDNRVALPGGPHGMISMKQPVISLEKLNQERLIAAAEKIRDIHGAAYDWKSRDYIPDDFLMKLVQGWTAFGDGSVTRKPRPFLRELIHILDLCEENPGIDLNEFFGIPMDAVTMATEISDILQD
jgi:hypothetical protein